MLMNMQDDKKQKQRYFAGEAVQNALICIQRLGGCQILAVDGNTSSRMVCYSKAGP